MMKIKFWITKSDDHYDALEGELTIPPELLRFVAACAAMLGKTQHGGHANPRSCREHADALLDELGLSE